MPKPLDTDKRQKWGGYLSELGDAVHRILLTEDLIRSHVETLKEELVNPGNAAMKSTIAEVREEGVAIKQPSGIRLIPFQEIIDAEAVIRYWLARNMAPDSTDFR